MSMITLQDSPRSAIIKMCQDNPGALTALCELFKAAKEIDPDGAFGGFGPILLLDSYGVYGSEIWVLYSDLFRKDGDAMVAALRCCQMGFLRMGALQEAAHTRTPIELAEPLSKLAERLPSFGRKSTPAVSR